jgi:hypothetical protein
LIISVSVTSLTLDGEIVGLSDQDLSGVVKTFVFNQDYLIGWFPVIIVGLILLILLILLIGIKSYLFTMLLRKINSRSVTFLKLLHAFNMLYASHLYHFLLNILLAMTLGWPIKIILKTADGLLAGLPRNPHLVLHLHKLLVVVLNICSFN